jgi:hypothetical protein
MNRLHQPRRQPVILSDSVNRKLNMYALAAGAAGVSLLALTPPAGAKVIYTKANKIIPTCRQQGSCFQLDLNHDKIADFTFPWYHSSDGANFSVRPAKGESKNLIWGTLSSTLLKVGGGRRGERQKVHVASALNAGVSVGLNSFKFKPGNYAMDGWGDACGTDSAGCGWGQWGEAQGKYLGLMFYVQGKVHYAWARLSAVKAGWKLTGYAYESVPNKTIITGKTKGPDVIMVRPPTLGHLAAGASAISDWPAKPASSATQ